MGWGWGERTKREGRISRYDHGNPPWSHEKHFLQMLRKRYKNKAKRRASDPTNPFGNPCGFGLALLYFGRRFWRYSQSPHGARIRAAERQGTFCLFPDLASAFILEGALCRQKQKRNRGLRARHQYRLLVGGAWCQNPEQFWTEVLALQSVTSWCQNWSSGARGRREAPAENLECET